MFTYTNAQILTAYLATIYTRATNHCYDKRFAGVNFRTSVFFTNGDRLSIWAVGSRPNGTTGANFDKYYNSIEVKVVDANGKTLHTEPVGQDVEAFTVDHNTSFADICTLVNNREIDWTHTFNVCTRIEDVQDGRFSIVNASSSFGYCLGVNALKDLIRDLASIDTLMASFHKFK